MENVFDPNALANIVPAQLFGQLIVVNGLLFLIMAKVNSLFPWKDKYDPLAAGGISALLNLALSAMGNHLYVESMIFGFLFGLLVTNSNHKDADKVADKVIDKLGFADTSGVIPHGDQR